jgi:hypothetical protein
MQTEREKSKKSNVVSKDAICTCGWCARPHTLQLDAGDRLARL